MLKRIWSHGDRLALVSADGSSLTYRELAGLSSLVSETLKRDHDEVFRLQKKRSAPAVGIFANYDPSFVWGTLGIWNAGGILTPIHNKYPPREIEYILRDTSAPVVVACPGLQDRLAASAAACGAVVSLLPAASAFSAPESSISPKIPKTSSLPKDSADFSAKLPVLPRDLAPEEPALLLYTSGTTGAPKGVLHTHGSVAAMVDALVTAWEWQADDRILHFLPMHHVHGLVNKLLCALHIGATVEFTGGASPAILWPRLARAGRQNHYVQNNYHQNNITNNSAGAGTTASKGKGASSPEKSGVRHPEERSENGAERSGNGGERSGNGAERSENGAAKRNLAGDPAASGGAPTVLMAVPTIYARLLEAAESGAVSAEDLASAKRAIAALRLSVSGSAALPDDVAARWKRLAGGRPLLERYGMTEIGMALSNPLRPEEARLPGYVGMPLPGVQVRIIADDEGSSSGGGGGGGGSGSGGSSGSSSGAKPAVVAPAGVEAPPGTAGELRVKGPAVFQEYWRRPDATAATFDAGGWFRTGDVASFDPDAGAYRIHGRASADIIKSAGYKISALDVERALLEHPAIAEAVVLGSPDPVFGERICAVVRQNTNSERGSGGCCGSGGGGNGSLKLELPALRFWLRERLPDYKIPSRLIVLPQGEEVPKNAMGKVNKRALLAALRDVPGIVDATL